jgi:D-lactate dehydrogenase
MRVAVFSTRPHDRAYLEAANTPHQHEFTFLEARLTAATLALASGFPAVCVFVNDRLDAAVLRGLHQHGTRLVALRCAGFNNVDLLAAAGLGVRVTRVPAYSPYAVAEHTVTLILALNRKIYRSYVRVREGNFALDGLLGFDLHGRTVGVVGTGKIGAVVVEIMTGFGCRVLAQDPTINPACEALGAEYVSLTDLLSRSDVVTLHCPLVPDTYHLIDAEALNHVRPGMMLINTSRGALIDTRAVIAALKSGRIGYLGLDVYEEEGDLFFQDLSGRVLQDDVFARLLTFPNVVITGHQAFFTHEALQGIAATTIHNLSAFERGEPLANEVTAERIRTR